jgi:N-acetylglucosamine kinase-like BadF-type ATPase
MAAGSASGRGRVAVLGVDGGGSKVDAALVRIDGALISAARVVNGRAGGAPSMRADAPGDGEDRERGPRRTPREDDLLDMSRNVAAAAAEVCRRAGIDPDGPAVARLGTFCLAGADFPADDRRFLRVLRTQGWAEETVVRNDTFAVLRAGTERDWGVAVVTGHGTNCSGVAPDGRTYRIPALGAASGDWGGGSDIGEAGLWHAIRATDGRGPPTILAEVVPAYFGLRRPRQVTEAIHFGRLRRDRIAEVTPVVFGAAIEGDAVAREIVDRQADEIVTMAGAAIRRLRMSTLDVEVVLGGGVFRNDDPVFFKRIRKGIAEVAAHARVHVLEAPPVTGAVLLGLDRLGAGRRAAGRLRAALTDECLTSETRSAMEE